MHTDGERYSDLEIKWNGLLSLSMACIQNYMVKTNKQTNQHNMQQTMILSRRSSTPMSAAAASSSARKGLHLLRCCMHPHAHNTQIKNKKIREKASRGYLGYCLLRKSIYSLQRIYCVYFVCSKEDSEVVCCLFIFCTRLHANFW